MKNQVKITAQKGQVNNKAVTTKDGIRPAISSNSNAVQPNTAFDEVKAEDLKFAGQTSTTNTQADTPKQQEAVKNDAIGQTDNVQVKEVLQPKKPALNLEQTLLLVQSLAERTAHRATYLGYIETLEDFVISQNDDDMGKTDDPSFKGCELTIRDGQGNVFVTNSASVIFGTVAFMKGRFNERLAEVEAEIVIPV